MTSRNEIPGTVYGNVVQAGAVDTVVFSGDHFTFPPPAQLPLPPRTFANRRTELATLSAWLDEDTDGSLVVVVSGTAGIGKSVLAVRWLHTVRARFADGYLYVDLGGYSAAGAIEPAQALEWCLLSLGVPARRIPDGESQRAALFRSLTADRAVALMLDDAVSVEQVRPLLPSSPRSVVVVTSRHRLTGLRTIGARHVQVTPFDVTASVDLLSTIVGEERTAAEPAAAHEMAQRCGGLPLVVAVMAARLDARPHRSLSNEVDAMTDKDQLRAVNGDDGGDDGVPVGEMFDSSYDDLPTDQARLYRLCALHPGAVFGLGVAAAMIDAPTADTESVVRALVERNLLTEVADWRFQYHDLVRNHAQELAARVDGEAVVVAASRRMVGWYLEGTVVADYTLRPTRRRIGSRFRRLREAPESLRFDRRFADHREALSWLGVERVNLMLAVKTVEKYGWDELTWEFCEALWGFVSYAREDWIMVYCGGVAAAVRCGNPDAEIRMRIFLGSVLTYRRRYDEAIEETTRALRQADENGDQFSKSTALLELATAWRGKDRLDIALGHLRQALQIRQEIDTPRAVTQCRRQIAGILTQLGEHEDAVTELLDALTTLPPLDIERAPVLIALGIAYLQCERPDDARRHLTEALELATKLGSELRRADALTALGELALATTNLTDARSHFAAAQVLYTRLGDPRADDIAARLASLTEK